MLGHGAVSELPLAAAFWSVENTVDNLLLTTGDDILLSGGGVILLLESGGAGTITVTPTPADLALTTVDPTVSIDILVAPTPADLALTTSGPTVDVSAPLIISPADAIYMEGWDYHGADETIDYDRYQTASMDAVNWRSTGGVDGGGYMRLYPSTTGLELFQLSSTLTEGSMTWWMRFAFDSGSSSPFVRVRNEVSGNAFYLRWERPGGVIELKDAGGSTLASSSTNFSGTPLNPSSWHQMSLIWSLGTSSDATISFYADGNHEFTASGVSTSEAVWDAIRITGATSGFLSSGDWLGFDDIQVQGASGSELPVNHKIYTSLPDTDTSTTDWTASSAGDHYADIDDTDPDQDTTYIESDAAATAEFTLSDITLDSGYSIIGVAVKALATRSSGSGTLTLGMKIGTDEINSSAKTVDGSVYKELFYYSMNDPAGGSWSETDVNNMSVTLEASEAGVRITQVRVEAMAIEETGGAGALSPDTPSVISVTGTVDEPVLTGSAYNHPSSVTHQFSRWQIVVDGGDPETEADIVYDSGYVTDLESHTGTLVGLDYGTDYDAYVTYVDDGGIEARSAAFDFTSTTVGKLSGLLIEFLESDGSTVVESHTVYTDSESYAEVKKEALERPAGAQYLKITPRKIGTEAKSGYIKEVSVDRGSKAIEFHPRAYMPELDDFYDHGAASVSEDIDWSLAKVQTIDVDQNSTFTFSNVRVGQTVEFFFTQDSTGSRTITLPAEVVGEPTWSTAADAVDWVKMTAVSASVIYVTEYRTGIS